MPEQTSEPHPPTEVLNVRNLHKHYPLGSFFSRRYLHAVDGIDITINAGETLALVGESGSGKSTVARTILRLQEPTAGEITVEGKSISNASRRELRRLRSRMQMVFQDPNESLNPRIRCGEQVAEPAWLSGHLSREEAIERAREILAGFRLPRNIEMRYPHQLSGGQLQRIGIARALITEPALLVLDEPTSSLDVSVQAQIINLLRELQMQRSLAYLFISHDLHVVSYVAHQIAVMYLGQIVEQGPTRTIFDNPAHPYTRALISAMPVDHPLKKRGRILLKGEPTSPIDPPARCRLAARCPFALPKCVEGNVDLVEVVPGHKVRCRRFAEEHVNGVWKPEPTGWSPPPVG